MNGDGFDDVVVGSYNDDKNGTQSGSARVFSGADGSTLHIFYGDSPDGLRGAWNDERLGEGITGYVVEYELVGPLPDAGMEFWSGNGHKYVVMNGSFGSRAGGCGFIRPPH